jgi:3-(3-hydroxy-phenyl)propionate hydroxylase
VLLEFGGQTLEAGAWEGRVQHVAATYDGGWQLPVLGHVAAPAAVLVRPDGYVAWVGEGSADGLAEALESWFGRPAH